jgi:DNA-binding response OmpR family regulator
MSKTILLADDSVTIRKVVELTFMEEDYELISVGAGNEALERAEESTPDLLIADVHMPEPGGYDVCRALREKDPTLPVLLLVGSFEPFDPAEVQACGADAFLKKPFDSQELLQKVEELLESRGEAGEGIEEEAPAVGEEAEAPFAFSAEPAAEISTEDSTASTEAAVEEITEEVSEEVRVEELRVKPSSETKEGLSDEAVEQIARRVVELLSNDAVREVAWEVVPDLAEVVIKDRLRELESQVE